MDMKIYKLKILSFERAYAIAKDKESCDFLNKLGIHACIKDSAMGKAIIEKVYKPPYSENKFELPVDVEVINLEDYVTGI